eukprot:7992097-Ditylum_brightwellii.AAC.1
MLSCLQMYSDVTLLRQKMKKHTNVLPVCLWSADGNNVILYREMIDQYIMLLTEPVTSLLAARECLGMFLKCPLATKCTIHSNPEQEIETVINNNDSSDSNLLVQQTKHAKRQSQSRANGYQKSMLTNSKNNPTTDDNAQHPNSKKKYNTKKTSTLKPSSQTVHSIDKASVLTYDISEYESSSSMSRKKSP